MNVAIVHAIVSGGHLVKTPSYDGEICYPEHPGTGFKPTVPGFESHRLHYLDWDDPLVKETMRRCTDAVDAVSHRVSCALVEGTSDDGGRSSHRPRHH